MNSGPTRLQILAANQQVRDGVLPHRHAPFARHTMRIPEADFKALCRLYPDLMAVDPAQKQAAWDRFEKSPFSEPYRVGKVVRGVTRNGVILKPL